jgi:hypothetical protein
MPRSSQWSGFIKPKEAWHGPSNFICRL